MFKVIAKQGKARRGEFLTLHGAVQTPVFMNVATQGAIKGALSGADLLDAGCQTALANTYHLHIRPGDELIKSLGGLHRFMAWDGPILTDSGGFQIFSLSGLRKITEEGVSFQSHVDGRRIFMSPEDSIRIQLNLGADIIMAFDECIAIPSPRDYVHQSCDRTYRWLLRCKDTAEQTKQGDGSSARFSKQGDGSPAYKMLETKQGDGSSAYKMLKTDSGFPEKAEEPSPCLDCGFPGKAEEPSPCLGQAEEPSPCLGSPCLVNLFGINQGAVFADIRVSHMKRIAELGLAGYAIGGLAVGETVQEMYDTVETVEEHMPADRPRYLMGVGTPQNIVEAVARGIDFFDCVLPARNGRHGKLYTSEGSINILNERYRDDAGPVDPLCVCHVCRTYSRAYIRHLFKAGEMLAMRLAVLHNLHYYNTLMSRIRCAIETGVFDKLRASFVG